MKWKALSDLLEDHLLPLKQTPPDTNVAMYLLTGIAIFYAPDNLIIMQPNHVLGLCIRKTL